MVRWETGVDLEGTHGKVEDRSGSRGKVEGSRTVCELKS